MSDVFVHVVDFKNTKISEAVTENCDGSYTIFLNSRMNKQKQRDSYRHALKHIEGDDFNKSDVNSIEKQAHGKGVNL